MAQNLSFQKVKFFHVLFAVLNRVSLTKIKRSSVCLPLSGFQNCPRGIKGTSIIGRRGPGINGSC